VNPVLLVVAGPNGAGKTTVTVRLREEHWSEAVEYLNADDVARGWSRHVGRAYGANREDHRPLRAVARELANRHPDRGPRSNLSDLRAPWESVFVIAANLGRIPR